MLIKSWTGNDVEARVGMDCVTGGGVYFEILDIIQSDCLIGEDSEPYMVSGCTMLHCPLIDGDLIQVDCGNNFGSFGIERYESPESRRVRHHNPDLRDSPDYKREN